MRSLPRCWVWSCAWISASSASGSGPELRDVAHVVRVDLGRRKGPGKRDPVEADAVGTVDARVDDEGAIDEDDESCLDGSGRDPEVLSDLAL